MATRALHCRLSELERSSIQTTPFAKLRPRIYSDKNPSSRIVLQPRLATLRSYGSDRSGFIKTAKDGGLSERVSPFVDRLFDYIDTTKKSHDFEIISGRLAMLVFAATVTTELMTGSSIFQKLDTQGIDEAAAACFGTIVFAAVFAWVSIGRHRVGGLFNITSNALIDSVVDQIVDGLFFGNEPNDVLDEP